MLARRLQKILAIGGLQHKIETPIVGEKLVEAGKDQGTFVSDGDIDALNRKRRFAGAAAPACSARRLRALVAGPDRRGCRHFFSLPRLHNGG